jgi:hypothetical protein
MTNPSAEMMLADGISDRTLSNGGYVIISNDERELIVAALRASSAPAAVRADEREKCAKIADQVATNAERRAAGHTAQSQAQEAAYNKMEGAQQVARQIRERVATPEQESTAAGEALRHIQSVYDEMCVKFSGVHSGDDTDSLLLRLHAAIRKLGGEPCASPPAAKTDGVREIDWNDIWERYLAQLDGEPSSPQGAMAFACAALSLTIPPSGDAA